MFIAHLPSGYLLAKTLKSKTNNWISWKLALLAGVVGSIFPDLDLLYFYILDARQNNHHTYITHIPIYWLSLYFLVSILFTITRKKRHLITWSIFMLGVFLHLILDTVSGGILWYHPVNNEYIVFSVVEARFDWWVLNFLLHWTFILEISILLIAAAVYFRTPKEHPIKIKRKRTKMPGAF